MRIFFLISVVSAFSLSLMARRKSKSAVPIVPEAIAYGVALFINVWYAFRLPFPRIGVWISDFSRPIAGMIYDYLQ